MNEETSLIMKEFVAYSRKLLRELKRLKKLHEEGNTEEVRKLIDELITDTENDISA